MRGRLIVFIYVIEKVKAIQPTYSWTLVSRLIVMAHNNNTTAYVVTHRYHVPGFYSASITDTRARLQSAHSQISNLRLFELSVESTLS